MYWSLELATRDAFNFQFQFIYRRTDVRAMIAPSCSMTVSLLRLKYQFALTSFFRMIPCLLFRLLAVFRLSSSASHRQHTADPFGRIQHIDLACVRRASWMHWRPPTRSTLFGMLAAQIYAHYVTTPHSVSWCICLRASRLSTVFFLIYYFNTVTGILKWFLFSLSCVVSGKRFLLHAQR